MEPCSKCQGKHWQLAEQSVRADHQVTHTCVSCGQETDDKFRYDGKTGGRGFTMGSHAPARGSGGN